MIWITPLILEFCPDLSQRVYPDRNLLIMRRTSPKDEDESSKQCDDEHHASNQSTTILDEHKNLHINIFDKHSSAVSPKGLYTVEHTIVFD
jgi:hypothetical protein